MSAPVTAEELAAAGSCAVSLTSIAPYHAKSARFGGASFEFHARAQTTAERAAELLPRLARDLTAERAEIQAMANMLDEAGIGHHEGDTVRSRLARMIADANTEARRTEQAEAERDALADRVLDLGRELEALRAAVRAHEAATVTARAADLDLWTAAKVKP